MVGPEPLEDLLRSLAPQVLGTLMRRYGRLDTCEDAVLDTCEDAVQEALLAAAMQWPSDGVPTNPHGWLVTVAARRMTDWIRSDVAHRRREEDIALATLPSGLVAPGADQPLADHDDTLKLLFLCCHPALSGPSQIALTLRAVGGLTTAEIARASSWCPKPRWRNASAVPNRRSSMRAPRSRCLPKPNGQSDCKLSCKRST